MASPPYNHNYSSAISPPYPSNAQLPQPPKRRQSDMPNSAPSIKRRKASMMSSTSISAAHPLRQTSFPPENNGLTPAYSRSPSMDTVSLASASLTGGAKKKKPRKSKGKDNDDGRARSATANEGTKGKRRASREKSAEESEEEAGGEETRLLRAKDDKKEDNRKRAMLTQHFDPDQFQRFEAWRSSKLSDATVRRVCCHHTTLKCYC
jgi:transcription initiation factor TFIID subunit 11